MDMKQDLREIISDVLAKREAEVAQDRAALDALEKVDFENATYGVLLKSYSVGGTMSLHVTHTGKLEDAIKKAEKFFNERVKDNLYPNCNVSIKLGDKAYWVPEEYWGQYRRKK